MGEWLWLDEESRRVADATRESTASQSRVPSQPLRRQCHRDLGVCSSTPWLCHPSFLSLFTSLASCCHLFLGSHRQDVRRVHRALEGDPSQPPGAGRDRPPVVEGIRCAFFAPRIHPAYFFPFPTSPSDHETETTKMMIVRITSLLFPGRLLRLPRMPWTSTSTTSTTVTGRRAKSSQWRPKSRARTLASRCSRRWDGWKGHLLVFRARVRGVLLSMTAACSTAIRPC